mgnify:CR=1 FL=1
MAGDVTMLVFELAGIRYGTDISHILGMERMRGREPHEYDSEGRIIFPKYGPTRIVDIVENLGEGSGHSTGIGSLRVLVMQGEEDNAGVVVDKVRGVRKIPFTQVYPLPSLLEGTTSPAIFGIARDGEEVLFLVDLRNLVEDAGKKDEGNERPRERG